MRATTLAIGAVTLVAFALWERRHPEPVVDMRLLRTPVFVAGGLVVGLHNLAMYALLFELPGLVKTLLPGETELQSRGFVVKINRLFRF